MEGLTYYLRRAAGFTLDLGFDDESRQFDNLIAAKAPDVTVRVMSRLPVFVLHCQVVQCRK